MTAGFSEGKEEEEAVVSPAVRVEAAESVTSHLSSKHTHSLPLSLSLSLSQEPVTGLSSRRPPFASVVACGGGRCPVPA